MRSLIALIGRNTSLFLDVFNAQQCPREFVAPHKDRVICDTMVPVVYCDLQEQQVGDISGSRSIHADGWRAPQDRRKPIRNTTRNNSERFLSKNRV
jgi:hypothetical protein